MPRHNELYERLPEHVDGRTQVDDQGDRRCSRAVIARDARDIADCRIGGELVGRSRPRRRRAQSVERFE